MVPGRPRSRSRCRPGSREGLEALLGDHAIVPAHPVRKEVVDCRRFDRAISPPSRANQEGTTLPKEVSVHALVYRDYFARTVRAADSVGRPVIDVVVTARTLEPLGKVVPGIGVARRVRP